MCWWQFDGQWCMTSSQLSALAGRVPCSGSVAEPEKEMTSPTRHVVPAVGATIVAEGAVLPTVIVSGALTAEAPAASVTRSRAT